MAKQLESVTATFAPIVTALVKAEDILGANRSWRATNPAQTQFLGRYFSQRGPIEEALKDTSPEQPLKVDSIASYEASVINEFLAGKGFNIALDPFTTPGEFGTASVMDVLVKWLYPGTSTQIVAANEQTYPAARLKQGVDIERSSLTGNPVAFIRAQHPDYKVGLTVPSEPVIDAFALLDFVESIGGTYLFPIYEYAGLVFPKVSLDQRVNIDWLKTLQTTGEDGLPAIVTQALQQTKHRMNEIGARAESGVALGVMRGMSPAPLVIDRPFVCWMEKAGISLPLFAGYINYSDWKDPESL